MTTTLSNHVYELKKINRCKIIFNNMKRNTILTQYTDNLYTNNIR